MSETKHGADMVAPAFGVRISDEPRTAQLPVRKIFGAEVRCCAGYAFSPSSAWRKPGILDGGFVFSTTRVLLSLPPIVCLPMTRAGRTARPVPLPGLQGRFHPHVRNAVRQP
jgi:hypothetical protein